MGAMELRQLATFQAIVREGSFLRAAEKLGYAQPTVTLHVQQLEAEFGVQLFVRQGRHMRVTEAGRLFEGLAIDILERVSTLQETMADLAGGAAGHIRLGALEPVANRDLPPLLAAFHGEHPRVRLTLDVGGTDLIAMRVADGALDLGICSAPPSYLGLGFEPLFDSAMALLIPDTHPLASKPTISVADLPSQTLLLTERSCAYRAAIERALQERGMNPYAGIEVSGLETVKRCVQQGLGVAFIPVAAADPLPDRTILRAVSGVDLNLRIGLVCKPDWGESRRALHVLMDHLRQKFSRRPTRTIVSG